MIVLDKYYQEGNYIIITLNDKYYDVSLKTDSSYYYCINRCGAYSCYCKDKDWVEGTWNGELLTYNLDRVFSENLFHFLKDNFTDILFLNRKALYKWIERNMYKFIETFYPKKMNDITTYLREMIKCGIFNRDFYDSVKKQFEENNKSILKLSITYDYDIETNTEIVFIDDKLFIIEDNIKGNILSLKNLIFNKIKNIFDLNEILIQIRNDLFNEEIIINDLSYIKILKYTKIILNYNKIREYHSNLGDKLSNLSDIKFDLNYISDIIHKFNDIESKWHYMLSNCQY